MACSTRSLLVLSVVFLSCGPTSTLSVVNCKSVGLSADFDESQLTLPQGADRLLVTGACSAMSVEPVKLEWTVTTPGGSTWGAQPLQCTRGRFELTVLVDPLEAFSVDGKLVAGMCESSSTRVDVTRTPPGAGAGAAGGGSAGGGATGGGVVVGGGASGGLSGGGVTGGGATGGGVVGGGVSGGGTAGGTGMGPGACTNGGVWAFCSAMGQVPNESALVNQLATQYSAELNRCARHNDEFKRIVLGALRQRDPRWGNNLVRGSPGDTNGNVIGYYYGPGAPIEGSPLTILVDLVTNCETASPTGPRTPQWRMVLPQDSTDLTRCCVPSGTVGVDAKAWTLLNTGTSGTGGGAAGGGTAGGGAGGGAVGTCGDAFTTSYCGGSRTPPNEYAFIQQLAAQHPTEFYNCDRHQDDFLQIVVRELRMRDPRWGFNWVRGMTGDSNGDVIGYYYGPGQPVEGSRFTTIIDVVGGCGAAGNGESVTWQVYGEADQQSCCAPNGAEAWTMVPRRY